MIRVLRLVAGALGVLLVLTAVPASAANRVTPRNFTGFGFDQCNAPDQAHMDAWLRTSKYWAVGIYIAGENRYCKDQPELTPGWVSTQLRNNWRLLPLNVGRQAWCNTNYKGKPRISPDPTNSFEKARAQGRDEAVASIRAAKALGIVRGSTLWYDIEHFDISKRRCRNSALSFLSAWTHVLHRRGWVSGIYSSASSGIKMLDDARLDPSSTIAMPDQVWFADWNGRVTVRSRYIADDGWMPHARVHQYQGDHVEKHGGMSINIDSNFLDLGRGSVPGKPRNRCHGTNIDFTRYPTIGMGSTGDLVRAAQCLLKEQGYFKHSITGYFGRITKRAVRQFRTDHGFNAGPRLIPVVWASLLSQGGEPLLKYGAAGEAVRRLQRALNARVGAGLAITGVFAKATMAGVKTYQGSLGIPKNGVFVPELWATLKLKN